VEGFVDGFSARKFNQLLGWFDFSGVEVFETKFNSIVSGSKIDLPCVKEVILDDCRTLRFLHAPKTESLRITAISSYNSLWSDNKEKTERLSEERLAFPRVTLLYLDDLADFWVFIQKPILRDLQTVETLVLDYSTSMIMGRFGEPLTPAGDWILFPRLQLLSVRLPKDFGLELGLLPQRIRSLFGYLPGNPPPALQICASAEVLEGAEKTLSTFTPKGVTLEVIREYE
jgi:hypothetical protein